MKLEHVALNVAAPAQAAEWYVKNLGMNIVHQRDSAPFVHFIADESGQICIEFYYDPPDQVPNYAEMDRSCFTSHSFRMTQRSIKKN